MKIRPPEWPCKIVRDVADERGTRIWIVGGPVRDLIMGRRVRDWDFAVDGDAMGLARAVGDAMGGAFFPLDEERATARVVLRTETGSPLSLDFAMLRGDGLKADLVERDFTVNAMALGRGDILIDPLDGQEDLATGQIRATSQHAFLNDPVRLLRAARLECELGFEIEPETEAWVRRDAPLLIQSAKERLRAEFTRGLAVNGASGFAERLAELGLLARVFPELDSLKGVTQSHPHRFDVWLHSLTVMDTLETVVATIAGEPAQEGLGRPLDIPTVAWGDLARALGQLQESLRDHLSVEVSSGRDRGLLLKLGALLHDIGKPRTRSVDDDGRVRFYNHERVGAQMAAARMRTLRFSRAEILHVAAIVTGHLRPAHLARSDKVSPRAIFRYFHDTGDAGVDIVLLGLADHLATWGPNLREQRWGRRLEIAELLLHHYFERRSETVNPTLPVDGNDLMRELDLVPGPEIGLLLDALREAVAAGEIETQREALDLASRLTDQMRSAARPDSKLRPRGGTTSRN